MVKSIKPKKIKKPVQKKKQVIQKQKQKVTQNVTVNIGKSSNKSRTSRSGPRKAQSPSNPTVISINNSIPSQQHPNYESFFNKAVDYYKNQNNQPTQQQQQAPITIQQPTANMFRNAFNQAN